METEELTKLVDGIYKNILDKFNPGARQMINAGKAYLKALHGAAAASRLYVDTITKLARQAQLGTWGGSSDIGGALMKIVEVYKENQEQQMNILKAFYVDLLVPLETNLEKDTKVVQSEQKKFLQQHKQRSETYSKAAAMMKKQRKKSRGSTKTGIAMDKELKNMQVLEEEKTKLDAFCEQSLKTAMTQERRRYGFVLERQCSLAKHYLSYYNQGLSAYQQNIDEWNEVAKTREFLPETVENMFSSRMRQVSFWPEEDLYSNPRSPKLEDDRLSIISQLRKTKSMDASCLDIRSIGDASSPMLSLSRAKSDFNLTASTHSLVQDCETPVRRPKSIAILSSQPPAWDIQLARALYAYLSSGENQLSFLEGDIIALMGERNKGWQFGENLRTQCNGWFPLAYTEILDDPTISPSHRLDVSGLNNPLQTGSNMSGTLASPSSGIAPGLTAFNGNSVEQLTPRMFGDTLHIHRSSANAKQIRRVTAVNNYIPPPALPAPVPTPQIPLSKQQISQSQTTNTILQYTMKNSNSATFPAAQNSHTTHAHPVRTERPPPMPPLPIHLQKPAKIGPAVGNVSLHSSNDSGFSNDPPPQPEADYSDDETLPMAKVPIRKSVRSIKNDDNNNKPVPQRPKTNTINEDLNENKIILKRTKSFWRFGKYNPDTEILEGMSMWKHRDLIDVNEIPITAIVTKPNKTVENNDLITSDHQSIDSDKTLNAKEETGEAEIYGTEIINREVSLSKRESFKKSNAKLSLPIRKNSETGNIDFENHFHRKNQFYDDDGDGLIMRTVNRKDILKQYDSTDLESDSEIISNDPYDCIVVDDHTTHTQQKRNTAKRDNFPNVAEIGKKLEQFSKTHQNIHKMNARNNQTNSEELLTLQLRNNDVLTTKKDEKNHSFTTFGIEEMPKVKKRTIATNNEKEEYLDDTSGEDSSKYPENNRQFLPRTKLLKNNGPSIQIKYEKEIVGVTQYDLLPNHRNIYGPWYDLWGLDATVSK